MTAVRQKPLEYGNAGESWSNSGWEVFTKIASSEALSRPKDHWELIAPRLPLRNSPLQASGNGNQGCYLAGISDELGSLVLSLAESVNPFLANAIKQHQTEQEEEATEAAIKTSALSTTEKVQLIKAHIGQGLFHMNLAKIEPACRVTGVTDRASLIASHIKH